LADPRGLAFAAVAADYDRGRAGWPPELVDAVGGETIRLLRRLVAELRPGLLRALPDSRYTLGLVARVLTTERT
jgi:hypothetical protein